jgi:RNase P subunit RPR2
VRRLTKCERDRKIKVKFPSYDVYITGDEEMFQCENCGAVITGEGVEIKHTGRTGSILVIRCPRCGSECYYDELINFTIRIIPKDSRR